MGAVIKIDFREEQVNRCAMVQSLESGAAEDLAMVANTFRAALGFHDAGDALEVRAVPGALAAAHRLGITAPVFVFERVARAVRLAERDLPADAPALDRSNAARNAALQLGLMTIEADIAAEIAGPSHEIADQLLRSMP